MHYAVELIHLQIAIAENKPDYIAISIKISN